MLQYFVGENSIILFLQSMNFLCCTVYGKIFVDYELSKFNGRFNFFFLICKFIASKNFGLYMYICNCHVFLLRPTGEGGDEAALKPKKRERREKEAKDVNKTAGDDDDDQEGDEGEKWETVQRKGIGRDVRNYKENNNLVVYYSSSNDCHSLKCNVTILFIF